MFAEYLKAAMRRAKYEILPDDGSFYGEVPGCEGVWANAATLESCREELKEVLEEWVLFRVCQHLSVPVIEGMDLSISEPA
jgi:predicted RNase H-like HicB family nuclease